MSSIAHQTGLVGEFLGAARERGYNLGQYLAIGFQLGLFLIVVYLFDFSEPRLPLGWHAVKRIPGEASSVVVLHP
jgi:hypothetical protein